MRNIKAGAEENSDSNTSRRQAIALMLGASGWVAEARGAADGETPVRLAISETMLADVNLNDARAAMQLWLKRVMADLKVTIEISPEIFDPTEDILRRLRSGQLDAAALNIVEYRQIADLMDPSELIVGAGGSGPDQYLLLVKRTSEFRQLANLKGRRLCILNAPKMCVAPAWLSNLLADGHLGTAEQFFSALTSETKVTRVVLPVLFGQSDACLTSKRGFEMMCELNPQVARDLSAIATSAPMVVAFYAFRKGYQNPSRQKFIKLHTTLLANPAGRQLATLFQFDELTIRDGGCLLSALSILDAAERRRGNHG